jgi:hypothetical protein
MKRQKSTLRRRGTRVWRFLTAPLTLLTAASALTLGIALTLLVPSRLQAAESIVIITGGTTKSGFRIELDPSGAARYFSKYSTVEARRRQIPKLLVERFYSNLNAAQPLNSLQTAPCIKSVSFGYRLYVEFAGHKSPDLACEDGGDLKLRALIRDLNEIIRLMDSA